MRISAVAVLVPAVLALGCAKPWQAARTVVTVSAEAVNAAQLSIASQYEGSECATTENVEELTACVAALRELVEYVDVARASLLEGEAVVDVWEAAQTEPEEWRRWLTSSGLVLARLVALLEAAGVAVPPDVVSIADTIAGLLEGGAP